MVWLEVETKIKIADSEVPKFRKRIKEIGKFEKKERSQMIILQFKKTQCIRIRYHNSRRLGYHPDSCVNIR